jgi:hypothetical protein
MNNIVLLDRRVDLGPRSPALKTLLTAIVNNNMPTSAGHVSSFLFLPAVGIGCGSDLICGGVDSWIISNEHLDVGLDIGRDYCMSGV